jgi:hypothetical protein
VHRLSYNGAIAAGQLAVFPGASEVPISEFIRAKVRAGLAFATPKNSQLAVDDRNTGAEAPTYFLSTPPEQETVSSPKIAKFQAGLNI